MYSNTGGEGTGRAPGGGAATVRLYYTDAYLHEFTARVTEVVPSGDTGPGGVVLDRTAFYPTSGGQPHDTGRIAGTPVVDVIDRGEAIVHVLGAPFPPGLDVGTDVQASIDWERRFDHMQQHTAQHVVSAAFQRVLGAATVSVHLGDSSTLDLDITALDAKDARRVEDAVTAIVFENRAVTVRFIDASEAEGLGLRRPTGRTGELRVIEVEDWDLSACGGTHLHRTAEIGIVLLRRWERNKGQTRVEFLAGWRAVRDYQWKHALISEWSGRLTVRDREVGESWARLAVDAAARERELADARRLLLGYEAAERLAAAPVLGGRKVLRMELRDRAGDDVRLLLREMTGREPCVVVAGIQETGRLFFARSGEGPDMARLMETACRAAGGRGGGSAVFAQGAVPPGNAVLTALAAAERDAAAG
jgi:alanyl-tRNA synthetase